MRFVQVVRNLPSACQAGPVRQSSKRGHNALGRGKEKQFRGPMKNFFSSTNLAIWLVMIAGKVVLCLCILKKNLVRRLPWVSAYVFASTIKSLFLLVLTFLASYTVYYYSFFATSFVLSAIAFLTLLE